MVTLPRDPIRTRQRILKAARREFAAKGFAGARVDAIASFAAVNKRMLYHYFGNKEALFRAMLRQKIADRLDLIASAPDDSAELLPFLFERVRQDPEWVRLLQWEALAGVQGRVLGEEERQKAWREAVERVRDAQRAGRVHRDLDPAHLTLALMALTMFPLAFPQLTRIVTGHRPHDPAGRRGQAEFLRRLGHYLRPSASTEESDS
jgi:TetR/AcrR family transcriptional regulator